MALIRKTRIIGTETDVYSAWEPSEISGAHSTVTTIDGQWYGRIGTNPNPGAYEHLEAGSQARADAVDLAYDDVYMQAYDAILDEHPHLIEALRSRRATQHMGEIVHHNTGMARPDLESDDPTGSRYCNDCGHEVREFIEVERRSA